MFINIDMRNFWLNKIEKALRMLGYIPEILDHFTQDEKNALIMDEYLYMLKERAEDCSALSLEDMADFIIDARS